MSEIVERMAKALFLDRYPDCEEYWPHNLRSVASENAEDFRGHVRAVLEAMREPPDDLAEVMSRHASNGMVDWRDLHAAMINAALHD